MKRSFIFFAAALTPPPEGGRNSPGVSQTLSRQDWQYTRGGLWPLLYIHAAARFLKSSTEYIAPGLQSDAGLHVVRLSDAHNEKKRDAMTRGEATFHAFFPNLTDCEIFVPQHQTGAEYSDISRETAIAPAQCGRPKQRRANGRYAGLKVSCDIDNGVCELRVAPPPPSANNAPRGRVRFQVLSCTSLRLPRTFLITSPPPHTH